MNHRDVIVRCRELAHLEPVLRKWTELIDEYCTKIRDMPYWYNERVNISVLAGAVWRLDGVALEELSVNKQYRSGSYTGRTDLKFRFAEKHHVVEAKHVWVGLSSRCKPSAADKALKSLGEACKDVGNYQATTGLEEQTDFKLGITFAVPFLPTTLLSTCDDGLNRLCDSVKQGDVDFAAWCFPQLGRDDHEGHIHPGVVLAGREVGS